MKFERAKPKHPHMEIAPLIDVIFLLLLFFMLSYNLASESSVRVTLPPSSTADTQPQGELVVSVNADGGLFLNDEPCGLDQLPMELRNHLQNTTQTQVSIRADEDTSLKLLMRVVDAVKTAGGSSFSIVTRSAR